MTAPAPSAEEQRASLSDPEFAPMPTPPRYPGQPGPRQLRMTERNIAFEIDDNGCYVWTGPLNSGGYGTAMYFGKLRTAHRAIWLDTVGQIADGLHLDHLCRNRACINPDHMEPVTAQENIRRGSSPTKTECKWGHSYTSENTLRDRNGRRLCRICRDLRNAARNRSTQ